MRARPWQWPVAPAGGDAMEHIRMWSPQQSSSLHSAGEATAGSSQSAGEAGGSIATSDRDACFRGLLDDALGEITRREPAYFVRFELALPPLRERAQSYLGHPLFAPYPQSALEDALASGVDHFRKRGVSMRQVGGEADHVDPVALVLCDAIVDAYAASCGRLNLSPGAAPDGGDPVTAFAERRAEPGVSYFDERTAAPPLVLVNACGMSLTLWSRLMQDRARPWRLIVPEIPGTDLIAGGMRAVSDFHADSAAIAATLDHARVDRADLVTWCSGARIAIEFAARFPDRVRSLVLVCPTLYGAAGVAPLPCPFEDDLSRIFATVGDEPKLAGMFADAFRDLMARGKLEDHPDRRAAALFGQPAREHMAALIAPLVKPEYLINYGHRVLRDQEHPIHQALGALQMPLLLLTGDHDNHVNNAFTGAVLKTWGVRCLNVRVKGAGHYLYDLQYRHFISILSAFLAGASPVPSARIEVEKAAA
jgi:pimeloyl-ACP methyl ester carboxylesterase